MNYLGISSEIMSNSDHQLQEKLALLCHTIKDEKIDKRLMLSLAFVDISMLFHREKFHQKD